MYQEQELVQTKEEEEINPIVVCGGNLQSIVADQSLYVSEIHYQVGNLSYIENAD